MNAHVQVSPDSDEFATQPSGPLRGDVAPLGDKSISHRALLLAALADGESLVRGLSLGEDVQATRHAIEACGARVVAESEGELRIEGGPSRLHESETVIDMGNAGTGMRLFAGWAAAHPWLTVLTGDESLCRRDMFRVVEPLRAMGATVDGRAEGHLAPLVIRGGGLRGITYESMPGTAQAKSAVLLAGLGARGETVVHESLPARAHTEEMLAAFGASIDSIPGPAGDVTTTLRPSSVQPFSFDVPADPSSAAFWAVGAAIVDSSDVTVHNVYVGPFRGGVFDVLERMGADISRTMTTPQSADITIRQSELEGTVIGGAEIPSLIDELPVLAVAASQARGVTHVRDAGEMRAKESDRIAAVVTQLQAIGVSITEQPDGFIVEGTGGKPLRGGRVVAHLDHRIAMMGAIAGLVSTQGVCVTGWKTVASSYPTFESDLTQLIGQVRPTGYKGEVDQ